MLRDLGTACGFVLRVLRKIVDPENAGLVRIEGAGRAVSRGGELLAQKIRDLDNFQFFPARKADNTRSPELFFDLRGDVAVFRQQIQR